jgi:hypothetical protein
VFVSSSRTSALDSREGEAEAHAQLDRARQQLAVDSWLHHSSARMSVSGIGVHHLMVSWHYCFERHMLPFRLLWESYVAIPASLSVMLPFQLPWDSHVAIPTAQRVMCCHSNCSDSHVAIPTLITIKGIAIWVNNDISRLWGNSVMLHTLWMAADYILSFGISKTWLHSLFVLVQFTDRTE